MLVTDEAIYQSEDILQNYNCECTFMIFKIYYLYK